MDREIAKKLASKMTFYNTEPAVELVGSLYSEGYEIVSRLVGEDREAQKKEWEE